jgi:hypothetical protein
MRLHALLLAAALFSSAGALACGVCVEDKMAAVYDHAVIGKAFGQKHHVAFFHVDGSLAAGAATKRLLAKAVEASASADKDSVRVSIESASLAVAFDPRRTPVAALQKDLERRLAPNKLSLMLMQVLERPADINPSVARALHARGK